MSDNKSTEILPKVALDYIDAVVKRVRYRKKIRQEVYAELVDHFCMALKDCAAEEERHEAAEKLIAEFGNVKVLAGLIRRGKKRCRSLWRKIVSRTFMAIGYLFLFSIVYCAWFWLGQPSPSINYLEALNQEVRPYITQEDNAWPHYEKAFEFFVVPDTKTTEARKKFFLTHGSNYRRSNLEAKDKELLAGWANKNEQAWSEYMAASVKPYLQLDYRLGDYNLRESDSQVDSWLLGILMPNLADIKAISQIGVIRSMQAVDNGNNKEAVDCCIALLNSSGHWQKRATLIEALVGMAIGTYGSFEMIDIAGRAELTAEELASAQERMYSAFSSGYPQLNFAGEKLWTLDTIQQCFTNGGPGGGHPLPKYIFQLVDEQDYMLIAGGSLLHAGRDKTIEKVNELYDDFGQMALLSPYEQKNRGVSFEQKINEIPQHRYMIIHIMVPALHKVCRARYEHKANYEAALTVLAIKRWLAEKGELPENLEALVEAGLLKELPGDPYSDDSLVYRVEGDDFKLYSVGQNFVDDGGVYGSTDKGVKKLWGDNGDAVFWPN